MMPRILLTKGILVDICPELASLNPSHPNLLTLSWMSPGCPQLNPQSIMSFLCACASVHQDEKYEHWWLSPDTM